VNRGAPARLRFDRHLPIDQFDAFGDARQANPGPSLRHAHVEAPPEIAHRQMKLAAFTPQPHLHVPGCAVLRGIVQGLLKDPE
jgi:hypothetical protein